MRNLIVALDGIGSSCLSNYATLSLHSPLLNLIDLANVVGTKVIFPRLGCFRANIFDNSSTKVPPLSQIVYINTRILQPFPSNTFQTQKVTENRKTMRLILPLIVFATSTFARDSMASFDTLDTAVNQMIDVLQTEPDFPPENAFIVGKDMVGISNLRKVQGVAYWTQHKVTKQETVWGDWGPSSCMLSNEFSAVPITLTMSENSSGNGTWKSGFNADFGQTAASHLGYMVFGINPNSGVRTYTVPAYSFGQVWKRQMVIQQDQQYRECEKTMVDGSAFTCGEWSKEVHGEMPVANGVSYGWRTVWNKLDPENCGTWS
ncbi:hypothetical protein JCM33374_g2463 [Metschnikowia sp. JCM 33374]|nr:hypothetical protein JCM33374_g2463 [Metschnikowia sp. JCM 33374]